MIKINLLPHKKLKAVEKGVLKLRAIVAVATVVVVLVIGYMFFKQTGDKRDLEAKRDETAQRLAQLKHKVKEVEGYERTRKEFEQKLATIQSLEKKRVPVELLLNELNSSNIREVWFTALQATGSFFSLDAMARDNRANVDAFVGKLKADPSFADIKVIDVKEDSSTGPRKYAFKVSGRLTGYDQPAAVLTVQQAPAATPAAAAKPQPAPAVKPQPAPAVKPQPAPAVKTQPAPGKPKPPQAGKPSPDNKRQGTPAGPQL